MNKIVTRVPASALPRDLRGDIDDTRLVEVTVEDIGDLDPSRTEAARAARRASFEALMARRPTYLNTTTEEAVARIRELRDEWDD